MEVKNLSFSYGSTEVLRNISFRVPRGKITTILGPNGCGKSTLFQLMTKNFSPQKGTILLNNENIQNIKLREFAKKVAIVHQNNTAPSDITVEKLVSYGRTPYHSACLAGQTEDDEKLICRAMEITGVLPFAERKLSQLSGGQKQRVWIAMALAQNTEFLFLDEPTTYLDIRYQIETLQLVRRLNKECKCTIVMVLHDINQAIHFSDCIVAMSGGEIVAQGDSQGIITENVLESIYGIHLPVKELNGQKLVVNF